MVTGVVFPLTTVIEGLGEDSSLLLLSLALVSREGLSVRGEESSGGRPAWGAEIEELAMGWYPATGEGEKSRLRHCERQWSL